MLFGCKVLHCINDEDQETFRYKTLRRTNAVDSHKVYELRVFERGQYSSRLVSMGKKACHWLLSKLEQTVLDRNSRYFFTFRESDIVYMFQKCSNAFGNYIIMI